MNIGLWGLDFGSANLGCRALSYSFLEIIKDILNKAKHPYKLYVFTQEYFKIADNFALFDNVEFVEYHFKQINSIRKMISIVNTCEMIFDFTAGDSFSDIYGLKRFMKTAILKSFVSKKTKLILGPQTYGPFESYISKVWGAKIIANAYKVYARDSVSKELAEKISQRAVEEAIDVAFALPYDLDCKYSECDGMKHIGINISGLLWNGGYSGNNQFSLKTDYKEYNKRLVSWLLQDGYQIHLLGHVFCNNYPIEDDMRACKELNGLFKNQCIVAPVFKSPMEAKSYIAKLDCLVGARMHATIAAISSGCPVIPFAYSRKFIGLYNTLNYQYVIDGRLLNIQESLKKTQEYINHLEEIRDHLVKSTKMADEKIDIFITSIKDLIMEQEK